MGGFFKVGTCDLEINRPRGRESVEGNNTFVLPQSPRARGAWGRPQLVGRPNSRTSRCGGIGRMCSHNLWLDIPPTFPRARRGIRLLWDFPTIRPNVPAREEPGVGTDFVPTHLNQRPRARMYRKSLGPKLGSASLPRARGEANLRSPNPGSAKPTSPRARSLLVAAQLVHPLNPLTTSPRAMTYRRSCCWRQHDAN